MSSSKSQLRIDDISARFSSLLGEAGASLEHPTFDATWQAFAAFCRESVECDDEKLFFECDSSTSQPDSFYVHFARTCFGREPKGHVWSYEVICDFLFPLDEKLETLSYSLEVDEIVDSPEEREEFLRQAQSKTKIWQALSASQPSKAEIYIGES
jgi:hypothetical protein